MILEVANLDVIPSKAIEFEKDFSIAKQIIARQNGFLNLSLQKCLEKSSRYILLVSWERLEYHTEGFRKSEDYQEWKRLLHHYYDPFPEVDHYEQIIYLE